MSHGLFLLRPSHLVYVLGGKVANLVEKWELNKVNHILLDKRISTFIIITVNGYGINTGFLLL